MPITAWKGGKLNYNTHRFCSLCDIIIPISETVRGTTGREVCPECGRLVRCNPRRPKRYKEKRKGEERDDN